VNNMKAFMIREATSADVPALARLHVTTFNETHAPVLMNGPTYEVREHQWGRRSNRPTGAGSVSLSKTPTASC